MKLPISIEEDKIVAFCLKHSILKLSLFGSILTEHFDDESDVDVLVEFDPAKIPGLIRLAAMERELSSVIGRKADIRTPNDLSHYFRDEVLGRAVIQYAA
jgi:predicted nucleotidyltransferase